VTNFKEKLTPNDIVIRTQGVILAEVVKHSYTILRVYVGPVAGVGNRGIVSWKRLSFGAASHLLSAITLLCRKSRTICRCLVGPVIHREKAKLLRA